MNTNANERSQDTQMLLVRQRQNQLRGTFDLADFVLKHGCFSPQNRVLDLGAGTGQPLLSRWSEVGVTEYYAFDYSASSLQHLAEDAARMNLRAITHCGDMDDLVEPTYAPALRGLTHVLAIYSLYYSKDAGALLNALRSRLRENGAVIVVGPAPGNNSEWFDLLTEAGMEIPSKLLAVSEYFFPELIEPLGRRLFQNQEQHDTENQVSFSSAELLAYWRSNTYFDPRHDEQVKAAIERRFSEQSGFTITKRIRLLRIESPRLES